ncbi:hypothetical protein BSKO_04970 [Bryopsis sp. KO-2023]|nr:hypothetical protein BSKO_04970 [Bryopsis sp. KO-2023]
MALTEAETSDINTQFLLTSGYLVFFMQCGFCMLSAGSVRGKNAKNIILKNLLDACFGALGFYFFGFGLAYGEGGTFAGEKFFALNELPTSRYGEFFFQYAFAATAATIVSGAVAERTKFEAYLLYAFFLTSFVYPIVVHWIWDGNGWLSAFRDEKDLFNGSGMVDFAGCGVVHMTGGFAGLAGAAIVGPRIGRYQNGKAQDIPGHSASLALLGVFILWFGWYGFNPGSALALIGASEIAALCAVTTTLAAAAGTLSTLGLSMLLSYMSTNRVVWDTIAAGNGALAGLVSITAATSVVHPWAAVVIGFLGGIFYVGASNLVAHVLKVDDPLDAVAVHGFCGIWGLLAAAAFADEDLMRLSYGTLENDKPRAYGFIAGGDGKLLVAALTGIAVVFIWVMGWMVPFFYITKYLNLLRVDAAEEHEGLDISHHGGSAYPKDLVKMEGGGDLRKEVETMKAEIEMLRQKS